MNFDIMRISKEDWPKFSEAAHLSVFKEFMEQGAERIDFALLVSDEKSKLILYTTFIEADKYSLYMQFGGSFPDRRGSVAAFKAYMAMLKWCAERYKSISFHTENNNYAMLKFGMAAGFKIVGVSNPKGKFLLEHYLNLEGK